MLNACNYCATCKLKRTFFIEFYRKTSSIFGDKAQSDLKRYHRLTEQKLPLMWIQEGSVCGGVLIAAHVFIQPNELHTFLNDHMIAYIFI